MRSKATHSDSEETERPNKPHMYEAKPIKQKDREATFWSGNRDEAFRHNHDIPKGRPERAIRRGHI